MKWIRFDSVGGASGDMILGALLGLGIDFAEFSARLEALLPGHFRLEFGPCVCGGISGVRARVLLPGGNCREHEHVHEGEHHHGHDPHDHDHHDHDPHEHEHVHEEEHHHGHHRFSEIRELIGSSPLPEAVRRRSIAAFTLLAEAEGRVHGKPAGEVAFHEVGAVDSIVDMVGCCLAFEMLGAEAVALSPLPVGSGTVRCAHGILPIPAPATAALLAAGNLPVADCDEPFELLTPTGAALLVSWPKRGPTGAARVLATADSFGQRRLLRRPNLLRAMLMEDSAESVPQPDCPDRAILLECNLDDITGEVVGPLTEKLLSTGALDVWTEPVFMKKQRPGVKLCVLAAPSGRERLAELIFEESTTFGIRFFPVEREVLDREPVRLETPLGEAVFKVGRRRGRVLSVKPELEDCRRIAAASGLPLKTVIREMQAFFDAENR